VLRVKHELVEREGLKKGHVVMFAIDVYP